MQPGERAVLTVLLLRGPQSTGEIRQRTDRLHTFSSLDEVEETLTWFIEYPHGPLVRRIPVGEGRRVETFAHLLSPAAADSQSVRDASPAAADNPAENDWRAWARVQIFDTRTVRPISNEVQSGSGPTPVSAHVRQGLGI